MPLACILVRRRNDKELYNKDSLHHLQYELNCSYSYRIDWDPVHTYAFSFETQLFCYGYGYRPHAYDDNDDRKCNFSTTLSRVICFENDTVAYSSGRLKTEKSF